jgi:gliding motility-associated-like protein
MKKSGFVNFPHYILTAMIVIAAIAMPARLLAQGHLKAQLNSTNCETSDMEAARWYFGQNAGLDFRGQNPVADLSNYTLNVPTSPAIASDSMGNVLFFTDGNKVWGRDYQLMPHGDSLHGFVGYTMPVLIVPQPGSNSIYYIFTTSRPKQNPNDPYTVYGLEYNVVDLSQNGGFGDVVVRNKVLLPPEVSSKLSAVKKSNGVDYWVVGHKFDSNEFCAFSVTSDGVDTTGYVSSKLGTIQAGPGETNNAVGYMKISPDGTKLALAIHGSEIYEIYNFDASSGVVSGVISSPPVFTDAYGIEFSADSKYLYTSTTSTSLPQPNFTPPSYMFQFDISKGAAIFTSYDTIAQDTLGSYFMGLQLGIDGRIYVARSPYGYAALGVVENPKRPGSACNFTSGALDLQGKRSRYGFPNFVQTYFDLPHFNVQNVCYADTTFFFLQDDSNIDNAVWQFGDPNSGNNTANGLSPTHIFSGAGTYSVQVTETYQGVDYGPYTETVIVEELPSTNMPDTVYMYPGSPVVLDAGPGFETYEWYPQYATTEKITVNQTGTYYVVLQNGYCCYNVDSVVVITFDVYVPNAFRPGGYNTIFKAVPTTNDAINNFAMYVYSRWGQQMFYTSEISQGWDGTINGQDAPGDVYVWLINYDVQREGKTDRIAYKGNVILLR